MAGRIPATVVTGFLGAGKTTLIRHLLDNSKGRRIALIINEFGDLGVDGSILEGCRISGCGDDGIVELSNGCICCAVAEEFAPAMLSLIELAEPPDHIVIETSGLALPQPLIKAFNWPELRTRVTVDGVVAVIDGPAVAEGRFAHDHAAVEHQRQADDSLDHETPIAELFEDQLASADIAVINKTDLLNEDEIAAVKDSLSGRIRSGASVIRAENGAVSPQLALGIAAGAEDSIANRSEIHHIHSEEGEAGHGDESDHDHDEFESFVAELPETVSAENLVAGIKAAMERHGLLRVKGFAAVRGRPMRLVVQAVGPRVDSYFDRQLNGSEQRRTRLVVIGQAGLDQAGISRDLAAAAED